MPFAPNIQLLLWLLDAFDGRELHSDPRYLRRLVRLLLNQTKNSPVDARGLLYIDRSYYDMMIESR